MKRQSSILAAGAFLILSIACPAWMAAQDTARGDVSAMHDCTQLPNSDHPKAAISNGLVDAVVFLPDAQHGYYRASRFDWSGVIGCLTYAGHSYFGQWFPRYDPLLNDSITGPVEEFRTGKTALGYDEAKPGDPFVKIGVGVLKKVSNAPYEFGYTYPLLDHGTYSTKVSRDKVTMTQHLTSPIGYGYIYRKTVRLEKGHPVLILEHRLKNTGTRTIVTDVYDHDFYMIDKQTTGPAMTIDFPFVPKPEQPLGEYASIQGKRITYLKELTHGEGVAGYLQGYGPSSSDYDFHIENHHTGAGVEQTGDHPLSRVYLWSIPTTICPEAYMSFTIPPGKTARWTIRYRFYTLPKSK